MKSPTKIIYFVFFLSGTAGLIYEIVWARLLVFIFGSTTNSIVATISAFLGGLAIGSLIFGRIADKIKPKELLKTYTYLEIGIGLSSALSLILIPLIKIIYANFTDGSSVSLSLLVFKFLLATFVLTIPTILMGATYPVLVRFLTLNKNFSTSVSISYLYAVNTLGAVLGVLLASFILIELIGLRGTLLFAVALNFIIALFIKLKIKKITFKKEVSILKSNYSSVLTKEAIFILILFAVSGFISIAYEVIWTRLLTPSTGNFVYAFAKILAIYLWGIGLGSLIYGKYQKRFKSKYRSFAICQIAIGIFAFASIYIIQSHSGLIASILIPLTILPSTIFMGIAFPNAVALLSNKHSGKVVGLVYFTNTIGSIFGAFMASFLLIPKIGSLQSLLLLCAINFMIALFFMIRIKPLKTIWLIPTLLLVIVSIFMFSFKRNALNNSLYQLSQTKNTNFVFKEDEVASVFAYNINGNQELVIDGIPTTSKVIETKLMAHIPISLHKDPKDVLVVAFGMGTTFRSSLSYDLNTDVVELVPTVPTIMGLFHEDAKNVLNNPKGHVIINDGRNYIFLTKKKYDIVTIDPPPPFNAAGTTVLYSKNFYQEIAKKLNPNGIVSLWLWNGSRNDDLTMVAKSFLDVFPYTIFFRSPNGPTGYFLEGSMSPIILDKDKLQWVQANKPKVVEDLKEWRDFKITQISDLLVGNRDDLVRWVGSSPPITDDRPQTEYFMLRHNFHNQSEITGYTINN